MVEVLGGRAREPTGPRRAPRTYPGPVQLQLRCAGPREDVEVPSVAQLRRVPKDRGTEPRVPFGPARHALETSPGEDRGQVEVVARNGRSAKSEQLPSEETAPTGQDEAKEAQEEEERKEEDICPTGGPLAARFQDKSEPVSGSCIRSEAGERNVAERRHGHPCGEQPVDEAHGHRPQGTPTSRVGVHRRRCRFRGAGFSDHRQQRPDAQSVSICSRDSPAGPYDQLCSWYTEREHPSRYYSRLQPRLYVFCLFLTMESENMR